MRTALIMKSNYWIKLYHEMNYDLKVHTLSDRLFRRMTQCFLFAGEMDEDGRLPPLNEMAFNLRVDIEQLETELFNLTECRILSIIDGSYYVTNFTKWQKARTAAERKSYQRSKEVKEIHHLLHDQHDIVTICETDKIRLDKDKIRLDDSSEPAEKPEAELFNTFYRATLLAPGGSKVKDNKYHATLSSWAKKGVTPDMITAALEIAAGKYTVTGPWSLNTIMANLIIKREQSHAALEGYTAG